MPGQKAGVEERRAQILAAAFGVAARHGLAGLTIRRVAAAAGLSHGLVHFHFRSKAELLSALLDWLLETTGAFRMPAASGGIEAPVERLLALVRQEMERAARERPRIHVFFDFWLMGTRHAGIRARMRAELERYREAFRPMVEDVLREEPARFAGMTAEALCAVIVAFIKGAAVQSVIDPRVFDAEQFTAAANTLLTHVDGSALGPRAVALPA